MPLDVVDEHLQSTVNAGWIGCRQKREGWLLDRERLQRLGCIAAAQHFLPGLTMGALDHIAVDRDRLALEAILQLLS